MSTKISSATRAKRRKRGRKYDLNQLTLSGTADDVDKSLQNIVRQYEHRLSTIMSSPESTFDTTFAILAEADGIAAYESIQCVLPALVSDDDLVRKKSSAAKRRLKTMWNETYSRSDLYTKLVEASKTLTHREAQDVQKKMLVKKTLALFEDAGSSLPDDVQSRYRALRSRASDLAMAFEQNINESNDVVYLTKDELVGVDGAFLASLPRTDDGAYVVSLKAPHTVPILQRAHLAATRKKVKNAMGSKCHATNGPIFADLLRARHEAARIAGFASHAEYMLRRKMALNPTTARSFCKSMIARMDKSLASDMATLREVKLKDVKKTSDASPQPDVVESWDISYLVDIVRREEYAVDNEKLKAHFPLRQTIERILSIFGEILGLRMRFAPELPRWHEEVLSYEVIEDGGDADFERGEVVGTFYLDLFPRQGKFAHQMILPLLPTFEDRSGGKCRPACCYIGNLSRPMNKDVPALLRYNEVKTMFHEFGHALHAICTKTSYSLLSWTWPMVPWYGGVEQDFLEVPSMMFEQWMTDANVIRRVAGHYKDTSIVIDDKTITQIQKMRNVMYSALHMKYWAMSLFDLNVHSSRSPYVFDNEAKTDHVDLFKAHVSRYAKRTAVGSDPVASWYHPAIGYDAGYYGYGWSEVYAHDLFSVFKRNGVLDAKTGRRLRQSILSKGATVPADVMLRDFLGRDPSADAFCKDHGLAL